MNVSNQALAETLQEISEYLIMQDVPFKPRAYEKAAGAVLDFEEEIAELYKKLGSKALESIPGVGLSIAEKIEEFITTGRVKYHEELKKKTPVNLSELRKIEGLGPKSIKKLYDELGVKNISDLEKAARSGKVGTLAGFGEKSEENILKGIEFGKKSGGRFLLGHILPELRYIEARLGAIRGVQKIIIAGSVRRRKETIGDADLLIASDEQGPIMDYFVRMPGVVRVYAHGDTKSSVRMATGFDVDMQVVPLESYGAALNYFTGSKDHNIAIRQIAIEKGYKLNEYGLYKLKTENSKLKTKEKKIIAGRTEEEIYNALGMDYIEPELRENSGEIEAATARALPRLIGYGDIQGDLQVQTDWTDGKESIEAMANAAIKKGLKYIVITDHTKRLAMTNGLDEKRILKQMTEIDRINSKLSSKEGSSSGGKTQNSKFRILKGTECDILKDGTMDLPDAILERLDVVGASVHSHFNLSREDQTKRIMRAMENPHVDILFHPTGRLINKREAYDADMDGIIKTAKKTGTVLEIDAFPDRLDLKDEYIRKCVDAGVKLSIDSDAHASAHFDYLEYGIAQARRGWAEKKDVINSLPCDKMLSFLKK